MGVKFKTNLSKVGMLLTIVVSTFILAVIFYSAAYAGKIFPRTYLGSENLGGLKKDEAQDRVVGILAPAQSQKLTFSDQSIGENKSFEISPDQLELSYKGDKTLNNLVSVGRSKNPLKRISQLFRSIFSQNKVAASFVIDQRKLEEKISQIAAVIDQPELDATLKIESGQIEVEPERVGKKVDRPTLRSVILQQISQVNLPSNHTLTVLQVNPKVVVKDAQRGIQEAEKILQMSLVLKYQNKKFEIQKEQIAGFLEFVSSAVAGVEKNKLDAQAISQDLKEGIPESIYTVSPRLNSDKIKNYVSELAKDINQQPKDAKLTIDGGRVKVFQLSQDGLVLEQEKAAQLILEALLSGQAEVILPVKVKKPQISSDTIDTLGIKELIGKGTTSFAKSPPNRIYNISVGAQTFNGVLIKPGEEFSFLKYLGQVDASTGYRPELVIKEDRTTPEFGGGLCQVSTTMFRGALATGLPITERQNHSYRVSYYEPPVGMDATIYIPKPDLKFKNDTAGYILIQTEISGNNLSFGFYGTSDGRRMETSQPEIWDIVPPGDPIYVDTPDLPAGELKQVEKAHPGSKAKFTYTVYSADGSVRNKQTFVSSYKIWKARFLRGTGGVPVEEQPPAEQQPPAENPPA